MRASIEVADIFRTAGAAYRAAHAGHLSLDQLKVMSRPTFLLPVRVLGALFRRLFLTRLMALHEAGRLGFFGSIAHLADRRAFLRHLSPVRKKRWVVYAKPPFAGPEAVLPICRATPTGWRSRAAASSGSTRVGSRSATRIIAAAAPTGSRS